MRTKPMFTYFKARNAASSREFHISHRTTSIAPVKIAKFLRYQWSTRNAYESTRVARGLNKRRNTPSGTRLRSATAFRTDPNWSGVKFWCGDVYWTNWRTGTVFKSRNPPESDPNYSHGRPVTPGKGSKQSRIRKSIKNVLPQASIFCNVHLLKLI